MKGAPDIDYKALYQQCLRHDKKQEKRIASLQDDITKTIQRQQHLSQAISGMQKTLIEKEGVIEVQKTSIEGHLQTIGNQALKMEQQEQLITSLDQLVVAQQKELTQQKKDLSHLAMVRHELKVLKKMIHGRRSEKHYSKDTTEQTDKAGEQLSLQMEVDQVGFRCIKNIQLIPQHTRQTTEVIPKKPHPGRHDFPEGMEEELIILDSPDRPPGSVRLRFEDTRQLACTDMRFYIKVYRRYFYMAPTADEFTFRQLVAPLPSHPIAKCKADISVLVKLIIDKFIYHLPTWRQQARFKQYGIEVKYNTLSNWINRIGDVLEPLYTALLHELIISGYLMMDETTYRVLDNEKQKGKKSHVGYLWACSNPIQKILAFSYQKRRGKKEVAHILTRFKGYLQTDGYSGYTKYGAQPGVVHLQCMAHARRYFSDSRSHDLKRSDHALEQFFGPLYKVEQQCRQAGLTYDEITDKRQQESILVLDSFYAWLKEELPRVTPNTPIHKAIAYSLNRFKELSIYVDDGMLEIDNNYTERQIRGIAIGRKNFMFAGSHRAGERAAIIYSLLGTCKLQGIDPRLWLDDVLRRLSTQPEDKLTELLPQFWKPLPKAIISENNQAGA
jgi:transposase